MDARMNLANEILLSNPAREASRPVTFGVMLLFTAGLCWGLLTAFSLASENFGTRTMALGLLIAVALGFVTLGTRVVMAGFTAPGLLLVAHVGVACISGWLGDSELKGCCVTWLSFLHSG